MSVLDEMTKGIMSQKAAKAQRLTPVAGESGTTVAQQAARIPDVPEVFLTAEAVADIARDLRVQVATLTAVADALDKYMPASAVDPAPAKVGKVEARLAGADPAVDPGNFAKDYKAKQEAAQAATFAALDDGDEPLPTVRGTNVDGWECPEHMEAALTTLTSGKGRVYRACQAPGCKQFEK